MSFFSKEERVAFEDTLAAYNDEMAMSYNVGKYDVPAQKLERAGDTIWRPMPYIGKSFDGTNQTGNFGGYTQLSVPSTVGYHKSVPLEMTVSELRDSVQEGNLGKAARQKLASDINNSIISTAGTYGTVVVKRTAAATGYDDVAEAEAAFDELGVNADDRIMALSSRDLNGMASNLAARQTLNDMPTQAFRKSYVGEVAGFETFKNATANRLTAAAGTTVTISAADQYHTPAATSTAGTGETSNVDNRTQVISIGVVSGTVKVGDKFTIAGVNSVHHITKQDTGQLKTFTITEIVTGAGGTGTVRISPAIVSAQGATLAEEIYKNVTATPANGAAITFLNTADAYINPFWHKSAIEIMPATYPVPAAGLEVLRGQTDQGLELVMSKQVDINDNSKVKIRFDTTWGVNALQPEMMGVMLFGQA